jgi:hypothetical protein
MFTADPQQQLHRHTIPNPLIVVIALMTVALAIFVAERVGSRGSAASDASRVLSQLPLDQRVLTPSTLPGFVRADQPADVRATPRLEKLGYIAGLNEKLHGEFPQLAEAVSVVEQFKTSAGARAALADQYRQVRGVTPFHVVGIPAARGWMQRSGATTGINVMFTSGSYYYLVGAGFPNAAHGGPTPAQVVAAAQGLYLEINGCSTRGSAAR